MDYASKIFCSNTRATNRNDIELQNIPNDETTEPLNEGEFQNKKVTLCTQVTNKISQGANWLRNNKGKAIIAFAIAAIFIPACIVVYNAAYNSFSGDTPTEYIRNITDSNTGNPVTQLVNNTDSTPEPSAMSEPYPQPSNSTATSGEQSRTFTSCTTLESLQENIQEVLICKQDQMPREEWNEKTKNIDTVSKFNIIYQYCSNSICRLIGTTTDAWNKLLKVTHKN